MKENLGPSQARVQEALARTLDQLKLQPGRYTVQGRVRLPDGDRSRWFNLKAVVRVPTTPWSGEDRRAGRPITSGDVRDAVRDALCERIRRRVGRPWDGRDRRGARQTTLDEIQKTLRADLQALLSDLKIKTWDGSDRRKAAPPAPNHDALLEAIRAELRRLPSVTIDSRAIATEIARHLSHAPASDEEPLVAAAPVEQVSIDDIQSMVDALLRRQR